MTEKIERAPMQRSILEDGTLPLTARSHREDTLRSRRRGGMAAAIGETDIFLYRSYAIVERLRQAVAERVSEI